MFLPWPEGFPALVPPSGPGKANGALLDIPHSGVYAPDMSRFIYPTRGLKTGHPGPLGWLFFWWLLIPIYLLWALVAAAFFVVLLPVNIVLLFTRQKPKPIAPRFDVYTGERIR